MTWPILDTPRADIAGQIDGFSGTRERTDWTDGTISIPKAGTRRRTEYDKRHLQAVIERFGGPHFQLTFICADVRTLTMTNLAVNRERYGLYKRMLRAEGSVPPIIVEARTMNVIDGNHRTQAALDVKQRLLPALLRTPTVERGESKAPKRIKKCPRKK